MDYVNLYSLDLCLDARLGGLSAKETSVLLGVEASSVNTYTSRAYGKLGVGSGEELVWLLSGRPMGSYHGFRQRWRGRNPLLAAGSREGTVRRLGDTADPKEAAAALNALMKDARGKPEENALQLLALRSMARARYSTDNVGHYGLAFPYYTHFTSPIRRYPDMMVHRLLAMYMDGASSQDKLYYEDCCEHSSVREQIATDAERASIKYKMVEFMQDKVGRVFEGHISGLTEWGIYVEIEPTKVEGMVSLREVRSDWYQFDEEKYETRGKASGRVFHLGDAVKVRVLRANLEQKIIDYELVEE